MTTQRYWETLHSIGKYFADSLDVKNLTNRLTHNSMGITKSLEHLLLFPCWYCFVLEFTSSECAFEEVLMELHKVNAISQLMTRQIKAFFVYLLCACIILGIFEYLSLSLWAVSRTLKSYLFVLFSNQGTKNIPLYLQIKKDF